MAKFGQTWWGQMWLNALSHIDFSNRLPRGRSYAGNGSVRDISIKANKIKAKVQGTRRTPYKVDITIPEFTAVQKKKLLEATAENPLILAKLINRELPQELFAMANENRIQIFPEKWKDFDMNCSCPDWAVPCKHIAAVIYIIGNEIDKNPFNLLKMKGLNIVSELEKTGMATERSQNPIPQTIMMLQAEKEPVKATKKQENSLNLQDLDFSVIPDLRDSILSILDDESLFYSGKFKPVLKKAYTQTAREINKQISVAEESENFNISDYEQFTSATVIINSDFFYFDTVLRSDKDEKHFSQKLGFEQLITYLDAVPAKYADRLAPPVRLIYTIYHFSVKLLQQSAFTPQILQLATKEYIIRQIPALINDSVKQIFDQIVAATPQDLVQVTEKAFKIKYLSNRDQVMLISSLFLDYFVDKYFGQAHVKANSRDRISRLFFTFDAYSFTELTEKETATSIYKWLGKLNVNLQNYVPLIRIEEEEDNYFALSLFVDSTKDPLNEPISLNDFLTKSQYANDKFAVLESLSNLSTHFSDISNLIATSGKEELFYDSASLPDVLFKIIPTIKLLGIKILLPKSLKNLVRPKSTLALTASDNAKSERSYLNLDKMLDFSWQIALGNAHVSVDEFARLVKGLSGIVKLKDQYVVVNQDEIQTLLNNLDKTDRITTQELLQAAVTEEYNATKISISAQAKALINELLNTKNVALPDSINAQLRPYQQTGYEWLYKNAKVGFGSIIADDMGLGKTLQVIATIQQLKVEGKLQKNKGLIVVPTTLLTNWTKEIEKFAPDLRAHVYHGPKRNLILEDIDLIITTYGTVRSDEKIIAKPNWSLIVIDEAQNIKNPGTGQTKAIKKIKAPIRIAMSGTPVENRLSEYWSIFDFTNKKYLGSINYFKKEFATPIELERNHEKLEKFRKITEPFIIRRVKTDKSIISDLPDKIQNDKYVHLTKEQTGIYQNVVNNIMTEMAAVEEESIQRKGLVLKLMTALKQICNHPSQFLKKDDFNPELSGKSLMLISLLERIYENNEKVLIFTQYREMGELLQKIIENHFQTPTLFLHGGVSRKNRDKMVDDFQNKSYLRTFILSIKAGGTGLNLTAANHIIHYDLWWNPAVENQATDRAFRIGQQKNVMVYRLITRGSFEEKINEMLISKQELANLTVSTGEKWIGDLSNNEIKDLVAL